MSFSSGFTKKLVRTSQLIAPGAGIDDALKRYNQQAIRKALHAANVPEQQKQELVGKMLKKMSAGNLVEDALIDAKWQQQEQSSGASLRANAETGQARGRATRTGTLNEDREMDKRYKRHGHDTARGGKIHGKGFRTGI